MSKGENNTVVEHGGGSIMFWSCFAIGGPGGLSGKKIKNWLLSPVKIKCY